MQGYGDGCRRLAAADCGRGASWTHAWSEWQLESCLSAAVSSNALIQPSTGMQGTRRTDEEKVCVLSTLPNYKNGEVYSMQPRRIEAHN